MKDEKAYKGCAWSLMGLIALSVALNVWLLTRGQVEPSVVVEHDTLWRDTTITHPTPTASTQTGEIVYIKVPIVGGCQGTGTWQDSATYQSPGSPLTSERPDSIEVPIAIEQKRYDDSLYTAWVSGFRPALDSIRLHQPEIVTTITKTVVQKAPRLSVGLSVGPGVSIDRDHHMGIYVGFTAQYRLWPK
jgi:hypothetical protein